VFERRAAWEAGWGLRDPKGGSCGRVGGRCLGVVVRRNCCKVLDDLLRILRLSRARFTTVPPVSVSARPAGGRQTYVIRTLWFSRSSFMLTQARSATAKM